MAASFELLLDPEKLRYVSVNEYRGRAKRFLSVPGMDLYLAPACLCLGEVGGQCILPIKPGVLDTVFLESFRHKHADLAPMMSYIHGLLSRETAEVDEAVPLFPVWGTNFWHWIFESLPAVLVLEKAGYQGQYIVPDLKHCLELMDMFQVARQRLLFPGKHYVIRNAIIPRLEHGRSLTRASGLAALLRENILEAAGVLPGKKFTYVRRTGTRRIANEEEVLCVLGKYDFEPFAPEEHPVKEQFRFMTNSAAAFMPHGANLAVTLSMPERSILMECFSYALVDYCCLPTVNLLKMLYFAIPQAVGSGQINAATGASDWQDITVDAEALGVFLDNILSRKGIFPV